MNHRIRMPRLTARRMAQFAAESRDVPSDQTLVPGRPAQAPTQAPKQGARGLVVAARSDIGRLRQSNQDAIIVCGALVGVADGMGGHNGGETASAGVRDSLCEQLRDADPSRDALRTAVKTANRLVWLKAQHTPSLSGMGTTLDAVWFSDQRACIAHVGDSRVYRMQAGRLEQITEDQSMVMEMFRSGLITREQADTHPMRNIITRAVGTDPTLDIDMITVGRRKGDIWLICSDGLHGMISDEQIAAILSHSAPERAADELIAAALQAGGRDNVSVVVVLDQEGCHE